jgi:uncharacterized protein
VTAEPGCQWERQLSPGAAIAFELEEGAAISLTQVDGQQVADLMSFRCDDPSERLSMFTTCVLNRSWRLSRGNRLVSSRARDLFVVEEDTSVGDHYLGGGYCNPGINERRFGDPGSASCEDNFLSVLEPFQLTGRDLNGDACLNAFMRVSYNPDGGFLVGEPRSRPGDRLVLRSQAAQIIAISNCPQERGPVNAGTAKPLRVGLH